MKNINWNDDTYQNFIDYLYSLQDLKYRDFHSSLGINKDYLIGVRTPLLKKIALDISKGDYNAFFKYNKHNTYEEIIIHGFIIGYLKDDFETIISLLNKYVTYIDNWALCDLICSNLHIWGNNTKNGLKFIKMALNSQNPWFNRVGIVLLLDYYINDEYIDYILDLVKDYKTDNYYVMMALAWLISICYIKYPNKTSDLLKNKILDKEIQNKAIQKIRESKRINQGIKKELLKWRI